MSKTGQWTQAEINRKKKKEAEIRDRKMQAEWLRRKLA
jgi:hypothetical protein|tara:strand:- start:216 stop:329 length:114 start_codon:yes stop_codon:yes gene_type:complete